jgi:hypothetical protein
MASALMLTPAAAADKDLLAKGFDVSIEELSFLLGFQNSVRFNPEITIAEEWGDRLQKLAVVDLKKSDNRYAYAFDPRSGRQIIAIRGTANLRNAMLDVEFWKDKSKELGVRLHHGFETAAALVLKDVSPKLDKSIPIIVCGHSLGAAEAIIVGMFLKKEGYLIDKIIASGPPKVTDAEGWRVFADLPVVRITAAFDPVPFLPPASMYPSSPFIQGGNLLMLLDGVFLTVAPPAFYDRMRPAFSMVEKLEEHFSVIDHRVWSYCDRLAEKAKGIEFVGFDVWDLYAKPRQAQKKP